MSFPLELDWWEGRTVQEWRTLWGLPRLHILGLTGSTNDDVRALAEQGAPALTMVIANQQTAGRGQHGRSWAGLPGKSLHLSALLRPVTLEHLPAAPVRIGLYVAHALKELGLLSVELKWPNDLLVKGRKLGGILCEGVSGPQSFVVAGIGVNVLQQREDFDQPLQDSAVSVALAGNPSSVADIAGAVAGALQNAAPLIGQPLTADELAALSRLDALLGRPLRINDTRNAVGLGIAADGALLVRDQGTLRSVRSGTVRIHETVS